MIPLFIYIKWACLATLFGAIFWWLYKHDTGWVNRLNTIRTADNEHRALYKALQMRGYLLLAILATVLTVTIFFDVQLALLMKRTESSSGATMQAHSNNNAMVTRRTSTIPTPGNDIAATQAEYTIANLFAEDNDMQGHSSSIDAIKRHYEEMVVSYHYLTRCGEADTSLLDKIWQSLGRKISTLGGNTNAIRAAISSAADGTYAVLYAQAPCDAEQSRRLKERITLQVLP